MIRKLPFMLIALCFLLSCGGDSLNYEPDYLPPAEPDIPKFEDFEVENPKGINKNTLNFHYTNDSTFMLGFRDKKMWVGCFNSNTKKQLNEWNGTEDYPDSNTRISLTDIYFIDALNMFVGYGYICTSDNGNQDRALFCLNNKNNTITCHPMNDYNTAELYEDAILFGNTDLYSIKDNHIILSSTTKYTENDSTYFVGFSKDKIQIRLYNEQTKELIHSWETKDSFDRNIRIHEGYGEYRDFHVNAISLISTHWGAEQVEIVKTSWGMALVPHYVQNIDEYNVCADIFFLKDNEIIRYRLGENIAGVIFVGLQKWYKESIYVDFADSKNERLILSPEGELIVELSRNYYEPNKENKYPLAYPISYTEAVYVGKMDTRPSTYVMRIDYTKEIGFNGYGSIWYTKIEGVKDDHGRKTVNLLDNKTNNWIYQLDITSYDGSKQTIKFSVNINTGEIKYL